MLYFFIFPQAKRNYERNFSEAEQALDSYKRAEADINLSRDEVENVSKEMLANIYSGFHFIAILMMGTFCYLQHFVWNRSFL